MLINVHIRNIRAKIESKMEISKYYLEGVRIMKRLINYGLAMVLSLSIALAMTACEKKEKGPEGDKEKGTKTDVGSAAKEDEPGSAAKTDETETAAGSTAGPSAVSDEDVISPETFWAIQIDRLETIIKQHESMIKIYEKFGGATEEAEKEIAELRRVFNQDMMQVLEKHGLTSSRGLFPRENKREIMQMRQQYLQDNPELKEKYQSLLRTRKELSDKLKEVKGEESAGTDTQSGGTAENTQTP